MTAAGAGSTPPAGWTRVEPMAGVSFAIPPDAARGEGTPVDSAAGYYTGDGYELTFDAGRYGETLDDYAGEPGYERSKRRVAGRPAVEVAFEPGEGGWAWARILQLDLGRGRTLTLRFSCSAREGCARADPVFASVRVEDG